MPVNISKHITNRMIIIQFDWREDNLQITEHHWEIIMFHIRIAIFAIVASLNIAMKGPFIIMYKWFCLSWWFSRAILNYQTMSPTLGQHSDSQMGLNHGRWYNFSQSTRHFGQQAAIFMLYFLRIKHDWLRNPNYIKGESSAIKDFKVAIFILLKVILITCQV